MNIFEIRVNPPKTELITFSKTTNIHGNWNIPWTVLVWRDVTQ